MYQGKKQYSNNNITNFQNGISSFGSNCVTSAPGLGVSGGGAGAYSAGLASGYALFSGTTTTITNNGTTVVSTGNAGGTSLVNPTYVSFTTGSNLGTTGQVAALANVATLYTQLNALSTNAAAIDISGFASALDAWNPTGAGLGVFVPGIYTTASSLGVTATKNITLSGAGDYVFITTGGHIVFGANDNIILTNGATAGRVWFVSSNYITTGANDNLAGNFINAGATAITIGSTNTLQGRLLNAGAGTIVIDGTSTTFQLPLFGSGSALAASTNTFGVRVNDILGVRVAPVNMPSLATATDMNGVVVGTLDFNDGTVSTTTKCCRMFTFLCDVNPLNGATTLSVVAGNTFPKNRPVNITTDINFGDSTKAIVGYAYVKNESSAVFTPGTTLLNSTGVTFSIGDAFGYPIF